MRNRTRAGLAWVLTSTAITLAIGIDGCSSSNSSSSSDDGGAQNEGAAEGASPDSSAPETSTTDTGTTETSANDTGAPETSSADTGTPEASPADTGAPEDSALDSALPEASSGHDGATEDAAAADSAAEDASPHDASPKDAAQDGSSPTDSGSPVDAADAGCTTLKVYNFDDWCSVSVNGGAFSSAPSQTVCVAPGSVPLEAKAADIAFELGPDPWLYISGAGGTDSGIAGSVDAGTSSTKVDVGATAGCVLVCCPFSSNGSGCTSAFPGFTTFRQQCP